MRTRALGRSGLQVSEVSLGSWLTLGSQIDLAETARLVHQAFDLGINLFDTADVYAEGQAEAALGQALSSLPRPQIVIATKCFFPVSNAPTDRGLSRKHIVDSVEQSLRRLGTDYIDLHQCHRADPMTPVEETVRAYEDLIRQGKVLYWGVSEWKGSHVEEACDVADFYGGYRPISNQPEYSILHRKIESETIDRCSKAGVSQIVFSPLAQGALTGKYSGGAIPSESRASDPSRSEWMSRYVTQETLSKVDELIVLAQEMDISTAQLALAWCLRLAEVASVIIGATNSNQLEENVGAVGVEIPSSIAQRIDEAFPAPTSASDRPSDEESAA